MSNNDALPDFGDSSNDDTSKEEGLVLEKEGAITIAKTNKKTIASTSTTKKTSSTMTKKKKKRIVMTAIIVVKKQKRQGGRRTRMVHRLKNQALLVNP